MKVQIKCKGESHEDADKRNEYFKEIGRAKVLKKVEEMIDEEIEWNKEDLKIIPENKGYDRLIGKSKGSISTWQKN